MFCNKQFRLTFAKLLTPARVRRRRSKERDDHLLTDHYSVQMQPTPMVNKHNIKNSNYQKKISSSSGVNIIAVMANSNNGTNNNTSETNIGNNNKNNNNSNNGTNNQNPNITSSSAIVNGNCEINKNNYKTRINNSLNYSANSSNDTNNNNKYKKNPAIGSRIDTTDCEIRLSDKSSNNNTDDCSSTI